MTKLEETFHLFNSRYFRNRLPRDTRVVYGKNPKNALGRCHQIRYRVLHPRGLPDSIGPWELTISPMLKKSFRLAALTLLHEMVHLEQKNKWGCTVGCHHFNRRMKELAKAGAMSGLW